MKVSPQQIKGWWVKGIVLDYHTVSSEFLGYDEKGKEQFSTTYTEIGDLLHRFKYKGEVAVLKDILSVSCKHLSGEGFAFDTVVPVPPSKSYRKVTQQIAKGLADLMGKQFEGNAIQKVKATEPLKQVEDLEERRKVLSGAFRALPQKLRGKNILLVDDLYRSGETLKAVASVAYREGGAESVYAFAVTRTRIKR